MLVLVCSLAIVASSVAQKQTPAPAPQPPATAETPASIPPDSPKYGVYPIGYREIITRWLGERLSNPASAKLEFGQPVAGQVTQKGVRASGYRVEFRVNSRNRFGTYTGFQRYQVLIKNGEIIWADRVKG